MARGRAKGAVGSYDTEKIAMPFSFAIPLAYANETATNHEWVAKPVYEQGYTTPVYFPNLSGILLTILRHTDTIVGERRGYYVYSSFTFGKEY